MDKLSQDLLKRYKQSKNGLELDFTSYPVTKPVVSPSLLVQQTEQSEPQVSKMEVSDYKTPDVAKQKSEMMGSSTTLGSEMQNSEVKRNNTFKVGNDLKLQWNQMMKEFENSSKRQSHSMSPVVAGNHD